MASSASPSAPAPVLVVEDNAHLLRIMKEILEFEGFATVPVASASEALEALDRMPASPLLIVSDIVMDDMDGCELLRLVRTRSAWPVTPLVFVSGKTPFDELCPELEFRADGYVEKPFTLDQFMTVIRAVINASSSPN